MLTISLAACDKGVISPGLDNYTEFTHGTDRQSRFYQNGDLTSTFWSNGVTNTLTLMHCQ